MIHFIFKFLLAVYFISLTTDAHSQTIRINEVVGSNLSFQDEDGDTPDWLELFNYGTAPIELTGMSLTDDLDQPDKWVFPELTLGAGQYLIVFASDKDRIKTGSYRTLINQGDEFKYLIPTEELGFRWLEFNYDDSDWETGASGFGYGDDDDVTLLPNGTKSVYLRKNFTISDPAQIESMFLDIDYDDGFRAFINGQFVAGDNIEGIAPAFDASSIFEHEAKIYQGGYPDRFDLPDPASFLQAGTNNISIQTHNISSTSSDLTVIPLLTAFYTDVSEEGSPPPHLVNIDGQYFHTNFKISSSGETLALFSNSGVLVDSLSTGPFIADISIGIPQNNASVIKYFDTPTPGLPNTGLDYWGYVDTKILFSKESGETNAFSLNLTGAAPLEKIRYTLDGSKPVFNSTEYQGPISISNTTVVRASKFRNGYVQSAVQSHTYFINQNHDLPIISLVIDPVDFIDEEEGMYSYGPQFSDDFPFFGANFWKDREKPVHVSLYDSAGNYQYGINAGIKVFGGYSRAFDQRSFSIFARKSYGSNKIKYPIFKSLPDSSFKSIVLRNSGNDWMIANIRDAIITSLMSDSGLEVQALQSHAAYVNGEYWGMYNVREKINEHFLSARSGFPTEDIDFLELDGQVKHGSAEEYQQMYEFIKNNDLSITDNYNHVSAQMDIDNHILYFFTQIYIDNQDWPGNNLKYWKAKGGKWRWILFDTDFGLGLWNVENYRNNTLAFALDPNGPVWGNPPWATLMLRKLVQNENYKNKFVNRFADEMNSTFLPNNVINNIDSLTAIIESEIPRHFERWNGPGDNWRFQIRDLKTFSNNRPIEVKRHVLSMFRLPAYHELTVVNNDTDHGFVLINERLRIGNDNWTGDYFEEVPISISAVARPGYKFSHWEQGSTATDSVLVLDLKSQLTVEPRFVKDGTSTEDITILPEVIIYPNPTSSILNIKVSKLSQGPLKIRLLDAKGSEIKVLQEFTNTSASIELKENFSEYASGIYFIELSGKQTETKTYKFIKN